MKKIIAILAVLIIATNLFAATGDKIYVRSQVNGKTPVFAIYGRTDAAVTAENYASSTKGTASGVNLDSSSDISEADVVAYFGFAQDNSEPTWAKEANPYYLTVSATELINSSYATIKTAVPTFSDATTNSAVVGSDKGITASQWNGQKLLLTYNGKHKVDNCFLGGFKLTWAHDDDLAVGTYVATITITVTNS